MKKLSSLLLINLFLISSLFAQQNVEPKHFQQQIDCKTCHKCDVPTKDDPCLIACPRVKMLKTYPSPESSPSVLIIKKLEDRYNPVVFSHRIHAQMSELSGGCETCHHYNTLGPILSCNECHSIKRLRDDVRNPDLKGAYHQQCITCHRQWNHKADCISCHELKKNGNKINIQQKIAEIGNKLHPKVKEPTKIVFETNYNKGKLVTFYHNDHTKIFGLDCVSCHKNDNCIFCHDKKDEINYKTLIYDKPIKLNLAESERHKMCSDCHKTRDCNLCHKEDIAKPFNHGISTCWALNNFHKQLTCIKCHKKNKFIKLNNQCISCHKDWTEGKFNHKITGLILDENHTDLDCSDCHINMEFIKKPTCDNCHDEKSFPKDKPGKLIKKVKP